MIDRRSLDEVAPDLAQLLRQDVERQRTNIQLIASENFASMATMQATGSVLTNKYSEGYPGRRYYEGCQVVDEIETLAIERAKSLFGAGHANVQPHSGSQANMAAYLAVLDPGDTVLGMRFDQGGHLTHGWPANFSGQLFDFVSYGLDRDTETIDMDEVHRLALEHRPKMILAGYSSYSRIIDWAAFRAIADEIGAVFLVDAAHILGLIAGKAHPNPVPHADIVTATTHKAVRGPRGGLILSTEEYASAIDKAVFPRTQGGAADNLIAAKALCFALCAQPEFEDYAHQVVRNAAVLADSMAEAGARIVSGKTENHMFLVDLQSIDEDLTGKAAAELLDQVGVTVNRNSIPFDSRPPLVTSGMRFGTPAVTTAGMRQEQMITLAHLVMQVLRNRNDEPALKQLEGDIADLAAAFPAYPADFPGYA
jgi:glycine hydroxymethyltransferase